MQKIFESIIDELEEYKKEHINSDEHYFIIANEIIRRIRKLAKEQEHDGCKGCAGERLSENTYPCKVCKQNYQDMYKRATNFDICCSSVSNMAQIIDIAKCGWTKEQIKEWLNKPAECIGNKESSLREGGRYDRKKRKGSTN